MEFPKQRTQGDFANPTGLSLLMGFGLLLAGSLAGSVLFMFILNAAGLGVFDASALDRLIDSGESGKLHLVRLGQGLVTLSSFAAAGFLWARLESTRPSALLKLRAFPGWRQAGLAAITVICALPLVELIHLDADSFSLPESLSFLEENIKALEETNFKTIKALLSDTSAGGILANIAIIALFPAIAEEIFFRGFLQQTLGRMMNGHAAVWISALIFSFVHFQFLGFFSRMMLGALMGYLFLYSGSLWTGIAAHFANNFFNVILAVLTLNGAFGEMELDAKYELPWWMHVASLLLTGLLFYFFLRLRPKPKIIPDE